MKKWVVVTFPPKGLDIINDRVSTRVLEIEIYCPLVRVRKPYRGVIKVKEVPMFFNYMFIYYNPELIPSSILSAFIPVRPLLFGGNLCMVDDDEIKSIKAREIVINESITKMREDPNVLSKFIGSQVIIRDGSFTGLSGKLIACPLPGMVEVELFIFNRLLKCTLLVDYIEIL